MANADAPFGLRPTGKVGQNRDNQGLSEYAIAADTAVIYHNDPVAIDSDGVIVRGTAGADNYLLGSLTGVFYTDSSTSKPTWSNHLAASNSATDIVGFVADDPYERFEVQSNNAGASAQTDVGNDADIAYTAGATPNYISKVELDDASLSATDGQLKIVGVSKDPDNSDIGAANVNWVVTINEHFLKQIAGI